MSSVPFITYPRRVVPLPDGGRVLVLIRRNFDAKINWFNNWDLRWEFARVRRLVLRDKTWRVELYRGVDIDSSSLPSEDADRVWVAADKTMAAALAVEISHCLNTEGLGSLPPA